MIISIIALIIGILIIIEGGYRLSKERNGDESKKIYIITCLAGSTMAAAALVKMFVF